MKNNQVLLLQVIDTYVGLSKYDGYQDYVMHNAVIANDSNSNNKIRSYLLDLVSKDNDLYLSEVELPEIVKKIKNQSGDDGWDNFVITGDNEREIIISIKPMTTL